ncbi:DNA recombination protein RmuC [Zymomonas mobilis]|uniref:DNA recombination protein RmuC n=1 Tax=Zymomonas mobilis TaxID=542 RepID=UPI0021C271E7|nr:DNA recombination protein RmuC [Zymomonas mobilis]MCP9307457.1 DNA recombination protein RmuC [Zymomonas mobilis]
MTAFLPFLAFLFGLIIAGLPLLWYIRQQKTALDGLQARVFEGAKAEEQARRIPALEQAVESWREKASLLMAEQAANKRGEEEREKAYRQQIEQLKATEDALSQKFDSLAAKTLEKAHGQFLEQAQMRFAKSEREGEAKLELLLQPVKDSLKRYEASVKEAEQLRQTEYGSLTALVSTMREGQEAVKNEANKLVNALRTAPKARGCWGEQQLRNVLESCGLSEYVDFETEVSVNSEKGRLRPDAIIRIPNGSILVVDSKVSLNAYQDAYDAVDEDKRQLYLQAHSKAIKAHIDGLSQKNYWDQFKEAPDYVIMFIPGEHFLSAALEQDHNLWEYAFQKRVLLATPTNLIAIARTVAAVWRQEDIAHNARKIGELGKELYERIAKVDAHMRALGNSLENSVKNYNKFVGSFESRVLVTARKFRELNIETKEQEIKEPPILEITPRMEDKE